MLCRLLPLALLLAGCGAAKSPADAPTWAKFVALDTDTFDAREASGFYVRPGVFVTCAHNIPRGSIPLGVKWPRRDTAVVSKILSIDRDSDLALLRVEGSRPWRCRWQVNRHRSPRDCGR